MSCRVPKSTVERLDVHAMSLESWLGLLSNPPKDVLFADYEFPTSEHLQQYVDTIGERSEKDVRQLLRRLLIPSGTLGADKRHAATLLMTQNSDPEMHRAMMEREYTRRLLLHETGRSKIPPWEGITWVLDLLPHFPGQALQVLSAYVLAHAQDLPDGRLRGLHEAATVIRARYIGLPKTPEEDVQFLLEREPRDLEHLVERLYSEMGYKTRLTPPQKDGGRDILARSQAVGRAERLRIECRRYTRPVGVGAARVLLGVVSDEKVNKGVLVTTSRFTDPAKKLADRNPLELISGDQLVRLMNEHLGANWPMHVDRLITASRLHDQTSGQYDDQL